jgi:hypothetical protein
MKPILQSVETATFLRNARIGSILPPDELRRAVRPAKQLPAIASYALQASVPNWLAERLDPSLPIAPRYQVIPTNDRRDFLLLVTLQCAGTQLRCVMQLSDPLTQAFLLDALDHQLFTMLFCIENTTKHAVLGVPLNLSAPQELRTRRYEASSALATMSERAAGKTRRR